MAGRCRNCFSALIDEPGAEPASAQHVMGELAWAAEQELVLHLDDLLLRRTRIGLLLAQGGAAELPRIRTLCQARLAGMTRWQREEQVIWRSGSAATACHDA